MKKVKIGEVVVVLFVLAIMATVAMAADCLEGKCSRALSQERICTVDDLNRVRNNLSGSYTQVCNIDLANTSFQPIGSLSQPFTGRYNGNGFTISNFSYSDPTGLSVGLFASVAGTVQNVTLQNVNVVGFITVGALAGTNIGYIDNSHVLSGVVNGVTEEGSRHVGGLVGFNGDFNLVHDDWSGTIINSSSAATVGSPEVSYVGGLVGVSSYGFPILNSYATGDVFGKGVVGGLVGMTAGEIRNSHASGDVFGEEHEKNGCTPTPVNKCVYTGGLVGMSSWQGVVDNSYATGAVRGYDNVGGLVGWIYANTKIDNSYAKGSAHGRTAIGGLVGGSSHAQAGATVNFPTITNSYSTGAPTGTEGTHVGGLLGYDKYSDSIATSSYWDTEASGVTTSALGEGKSTAEMYQEGTYIGWDFGKVWQINNGVSYPVLR